MSEWCCLNFSYLYHIQRKLLHVIFIKMSLHMMRPNVVTTKEFPAT